MAATTENTNNTTIRSILLAEKLTGSNFTNWYHNLRIVLGYEKKIKFVEQPTGPDPDPETADPDTIDKYYETVNLEQEVACLILSRRMSISKLLSFKDEELLGYTGTPRLSIREGKIQKDKKKPRGAKGKDNGNNKLAYAPKPKISSLPKRDNLAKDSVYHHCKEVGHWRRNCSSYQAELKKRKNASMASTSSIFTIELYAFPNKTWVYDTGYGTHICNTLQGLRESKKLKHKALSLYMGNRMRTTVEAIRSFDLILPSSLIVILDNCHFAPFVTRGVVSISRLVNNGYIHTFTNYGISVLKDNVYYFNAILRDGLYEIDMHNLYPNMVHKPFPHQVKRAKDLLGLIHTDICGTFRTVSREGARYFITFTDDFRRYGYFYLMKHKHKVFETFKIFHNEVESQLGKKIKAIQSDQGGEAAYILGINIIRDRSKQLIPLSQSAYLEKILKRFGWKTLRSAKQSTTAMSSTKAEYIVAAEVSMEAV
nr:hypothetical protein [Tanacetum cinerariifolium]